MPNIINNLNLGFKFRKFRNYNLLNINKINICPKILYI